jgi:hypothetical protein
MNYWRDKQMHLNGHKSPIGSPDGARGMFCGSFMLPTGSPDGAMKMLWNAFLLPIGSPDGALKSVHKNKLILTPWSIVYRPWSNKN